MRPMTWMEFFDSGSAMMRERILAIGILAIE
jgi:hypothetical protein